MATRPDLFDRNTRRLRRLRALRRGDAFLLGRGFDEMVHSLDSIARPIRRLLLVGALDPSWAKALARPDREVVAFEPALIGDEDRWDADGAGFDAVLAAGTLDTVNDLPRALLAIREAMAPDAPFLGFMIGGDSFPALRQALIEADRAAGAAAPRAHPRIDAPTLAALLQHAGFVSPVVDLDRVSLRYRSADRLIGDLRGSAATNLLAARSRRPVGKAWLGRLRNSLQPDGAPFEERVEFLHWLAWSAPERSRPESR
jgi:hypothetical protein